MIYLDNAATTPIRQEVVEAMTPYLTDYYGNASSLYSLGRKSKQAIETARQQVAELINADPEEIFFTSGGSESDNWALHSGTYYLSSIGKGLPTLITTQIEHPAILNTATAIDIRLSHLKYAVPDKDGLIPVESITNKISQPHGNMISVMLVNNEIGTIQPIKEITSASRAKDPDAIIHTDAVQAVGHIAINVKDLGVDLLSASAHKFNGPKGVGFLYIHKPLIDKMIPFINGGGQERNLRASTENVAGIVGTGVAAEIASKEQPREYLRLLNLSYILTTRLLDIPGSHLNGSSDFGVHRSPNNVNIRFDGITAEVLLALLNDHGICASAGSACHSNNPVPSHVLTSIGLTAEEASSSIRFTLGYQNTEDDIINLLETIKPIINMLRG